MPPPTRRIPAKQWDDHEDIIRELYYVKKLPLQGDEGEPCVIQILQDEHGFIASAAQYEAQFKKWKLAKNLKRHEWVQLLSQHDALISRNVQSRIMVSGSPVEEKRIKRARRYLNQPGTMSTSSATISTIPASRQAFVEFRNRTGDWSKYSETSQALVDTPQAKEPSCILTAGTTGENSQRDHNDASPMQIRSTPSLDFSFSCDPFWFPPPLSPSICDIGITLPTTHSPGYPSFDEYGPLGIGPFYSPFSGSNSASSTYRNKTPFFYQPENTLGFMTQSSVVQQTFNAAIHSTLDQSYGTHPKTLIHSLQNHAIEMMQAGPGYYEGLELPDADSIWNSLASLLEDSTIKSDVEPFVSLRLENIHTHVFIKALIYSIINSFAGLKNIPPGSIIRLLREYTELRSLMFKFLENCPRHMAKPFACNLFRAAIEGSDAEAVAFILDINKAYPDTINPNEFMFHGAFTPIAEAVRLGNVEVVRVLLAAKADPKLISCKYIYFHTILDFAIEYWTETKPFPTELVALLLAHEDKISLHFIESVVKRKGPIDMVLVHELFRHISESRHVLAFEDEEALGKILGYLENCHTTQIVQGLLKECELTGCGQCISAYPESMRRILIHAVKRGNKDLVYWLLNSTKQNYLPLPAAVEIGDHELVSYLLDKGATMGIVDTVDDDIYEFTTPLAEAVRARDNILLRRFEMLGAIPYLQDSHHFEAVLCAAAEVGDVRYLQKCIDHRLSNYRRFDPKRFQANIGLYLRIPLELAIENNRTAAAIVLLDAGADVENFSEALEAALKRQNKAVFEAIMDSGTGFIKNTPPYYHIGTLEAAIQWGDSQVIDLLISSWLEKTKIPYGKVKALFDHILHHASGQYLLAQATRALIKMLEKGEFDFERKIHTICLLLSRMVEKPGHWVTKAKREGDYDRLLRLLSIFPSRSSAEEFESLLFYVAILRKMSSLIDILLEAKVDIHNHRVFQASKISSFGLSISAKGGGDLELVRKLIRSGGDVNRIAISETDRFPYIGPGPFIPYTPLLLAIESGNKEMVELVVESGADVNKAARQRIKRTPLQAACEMGNLSIVRYLLQMGARVNDPPARRHGGTALQMAAEKGSIRLVQLLLDCGADVHAAPSNYEGRTAFESAAEHGRFDILGMLWAAASPAGFSEKEVQRARDFAKDRGHSGCVDYIDFLSSSTHGGQAYGTSIE